MCHLIWIYTVRPGHKGVYMEKGLKELVISLDPEQTVWLEWIIGVNIRR
jgi:hypothetical protein